MKKNKVLLFYIIVSICIYASLFFIKINKIKLNDYWFAAALILIGLYSFIYYLLYKLDSSLYYAVTVFFCGIANALQIFGNYSIYLFYPAYILCFAIASLAVFVLFRQNIHFKLFAILLIEAILLIGYKMKFLNIKQMLFANGFYLLLIIIRLMFRIRKNLRRVK